MYTTHTLLYPVMRKKKTSRRIIIVLSFDENDIDDYDVIKLRQHS